MAATPSEPAGIQQRIAIAEIDAVFGAVSVGVSAAAIASIVLTAGLLSFGYADLRVGLLRGLYLACCALAT